MFVDKKLQYRLLARNMRYSYIDGMAFSIFLGATVPSYLGLFILRFNARPELVNLITAIQPIVLVIVSVLATSYINSFQRKKPILIPFSYFQRLPLFIIAMIPLLPKPWQGWTFFILWGLLFIPWGVCSLSWSPMISGIVPDEMRGRFFGTRNTLTGITTLFGTIFTGVALSKLPFNQAFMAIFVVSFISVMISQYYLVRHIEPIVPGPGEDKKKIRRDAPGLDLAAIFRTFSHPEYGYIFRLSSLAIFIFHTGYSMAIPLYTLRQVQQLGFGNDTIAWITSLQSITALAGSYIGGRSSDRWGFRYVLLFSTLFSVFSPLIWATSNQLSWLIFASMLSGLTSSAYLICFFYLVLAVSPFEERSRFVGMNTIVGNLAATLGPLIGLVLIKIPSVGLRGALLAASLIMFCGAVFSFQVVKKGTC